MDVANRILVLESFNRLQQTLYQLAATLFHDANLYAWLSPPTKLDCARQEAYQLINQLEYTDTQKPRETIQHPGIIGASIETLELIKEINHYKDEFKQAMQVLKNDKKTLTDKVLNHSISEMLDKRHPHAQATLQRSGLARLHLKQCYRHIPLLQHKPSKVSWTWAHTRAIKRISVAQANAALNKKSASAGIAAQIQKLQQLPQDEMLGIVQEIAPHLRANIVSTIDGHTERCMIPGALPIFYPETAGSKPPVMSEPSEKQAKSTHRLTRSDQKLSEEVFLPALRAHRYL